jgi:hypothetical protein
MTWTDPLFTNFETGDVLTEPNLDTYILNNLEALEHPIGAPTTATDDWANLGTGEHTCYSVVVGANTMGTNGSVLMQMRGDYLKNNVDADTMTFRIKFGGVTLYADTFGTIGVSADRSPWRFDIDLMNLGATNSQFLSASFLMMDPNNTLPTAGIGPIVNTGTTVGLFMGLPSITTLGAVDTTSNQTLAFTVQWSASSANNSWRRRWARAYVAKN